MFICDLSGFILYIVDLPSFIRFDYGDSAVEFLCAAGIVDCRQEIRQYHFVFRSGNNIDPGRRAADGCLESGRPALIADLPLIIRA